MASQIRYSVITDKNPREILMLRGQGVVGADVVSAIITWILLLMRKKISV